MPAPLLLVFFTGLLGLVALACEEDAKVGQLGMSFGGYFSAHAGRIRDFFGRFPTGTPQPSVSSREELLAQEYSAAARAALDQQTAVFDAMDSEEIAPSAGLVVRTETFTSAPDGNAVKIQYFRPDNDHTVPCVYYIHGGRMEMNSCYQGNHRTWGRMIAAHGLAVAMVDFRNSVHPSSAEDTAAFPAGLNDCLSGLTWVRPGINRLSQHGALRDCATNGTSPVVPSRRP